MIFSATVYKKDCYKETMSIRLSLVGRAPVIASAHYVAMLDRSAFQVNIYKYCLLYTSDAADV